MSRFMFDMRDERDELDDEMCAAHYREMLLMDLAFNRHKRDYLAKWNSNRENWLKLVLGLEAQNVRVRTVIQEGSITHGDISWTFVDLDKKRRARQDAHYKGKISRLDAKVDAEEIKKLLQMQKDARKRLSESPLCMQRVPVFEKTITVPEEVVLLDSVVEAVAVFDGTPLERLFEHLAFSVQNDKAI